MKNTPNQLVFIRHGRTLANDIYSARRRGKTYNVDDESLVDSVPEWKHPINQTGIEQMERAKQWLEVELGGLATFDALYTSYYIRARQSAAVLGDGNVGWRIDDRLAEQHHGIYGATPYGERNTRHPETALLKSLSPWFLGYPGGESRAQMRERYRSFEDEQLAQDGINAALIVAHTGLINTARYHIESMLPEEQEVLERSEERPIRNGSILMYSKVNPLDTAHVSERYSWRRQVYPSHDQSPDNGEWVKVKNDRSFSANDLSAQSRQALST